MAEPKQPPYSIDAEQSVLGGICLQNSLLDDLASVLTDADFYRADHAQIYRALQQMHAARLPIDFVTLCDWLRDRGQLDEVGGVAYIGTITGDCPSAANVPTYAETVRQHAVLRKLIAAGQVIADMGFNPDGRPLPDLLDEAQRAVMDVTVGVGSDAESTSDLAVIWHSELSRRIESGYQGLPSGLRDLDAAIGGLEAGDLAIVAGRPGMGKTQFGLTLARYAARNAGTVLGFSMEMPKAQWITRLISAIGDVDMSRLKNPRTLDDVDHDNITWAITKVREMPFLIDDRSALTLAQVRAKARRAARKAPLKMILLDYLQLMSGEGRRSDNRTTEMDTISRGLKALAKDLNCPIVALAQLNRKVEEREDKRPRMSDIREAGGIEQDADIVIGLYRDEEYHADSPHKGVAEAILLKYRNGIKKTVELAFEGTFARFADYDGPPASARVPQPDGDTNRSKAKKKFGASSKASLGYGEVD
jgi:replicative DNA helicase